MRSTRWVTAAAALALFACSAAGYAQNDPYAELKSYDNNKREGSFAIYQMIREAGPDKAKTAAIETGLIGVLKDPATTFEGKQEACRMLWEVGTGRSVPVLAKMLSSEKESNIARYALERNADPAAGKALRGALATAKGEALIGAINSVGDRGDAEAAAPLKRFAASSDEGVRRAALIALGKIGTPAAIASLRAAPKTENELASKSMVRVSVKMAAAGQKAAAERVCVAVARDATAGVARGAAIRALAGMQSAQTVPVAMACLSAEDPGLQRVAGNTVGMLADASVTKGLEAKWTTLDEPARVALLSAWAARKDPSALPLVLNAVRDRDNEAVRVAGIQATRFYGGAQVVPALVESIANGLGRNDEARTVLISLNGKDVENAMLEIVRSGPGNQRDAVIRLLPDRPSPGAMAALVEAARGSNPGAASTALNALAQIGGVAQQADIVKVMLTTQNDGVREAAQRAAVATAQRLNDRDQVADPIVAALPTASAESKALLYDALANLGGDKAFDAIKEGTTSSDADVKRAAVRALAETWSDARPLDTLLSIAKGDQSKAIRVQALRGYIRMVDQDGGMAAGQKLERLSSAMAAAERPEEKRQVLGALRTIREPGSVELAAKALDDPDLFAEAGDAVVYLAAAQRVNNRDLPAVKGPATTAALDKIIANAKDDNLREQAQKAK